MKGNSKLQTFDQFMRQVLKIWPNAVIDEAEDGELRINTGMKHNAERDEVLQIEDDSFIMYEDERVLINRAFEE